MNALSTVTSWIDNEPVIGAEGGTPILNPATAEPVAQLYSADAATIEQALNAARKAWPGWRELPTPRRIEVLREFRRLISARTEDLAAVVTEQHGKTLPDARGEIQRAMETLDMVAGAAAYLQGRLTEQVARELDTFSSRHPLGTCVGITPFNFPILLAVMPMAVATAAANCFILKPSERTPGASALLAEIARDAGFPPGVFSVLQGGPDIVGRLIEAPSVQALSFVGSTAGALSVYTRAAAAGKRAQTFGGAKNHAVVLPDADLNRAVTAVASGAWGSAGQRCMATSVAVAVGPIADELVNRLASEARRLRLGDGRDGATDLGPVITQDARARITRLVSEGIHAGAKPVVDRSEESVAGFPNGFFVGPVLLDQVEPSMQVYREEVFGPVLCVVRVESLDEALELIRASDYGNGAALFTGSGAAARRFQREADAGQVGINVPVPVPTATFGSAGWKASAFGDTQMNAGAWDFYTKPKFITTHW